jgi:hypothetical protein
MEEIIIRKARLEDAERYVDLNNLVWRDAYKHIFPEEVFIEKENMKDIKMAQFCEYVESEENIVYVAEKAGELVGLMLAGTSSFYSYYAELGYDASLIVNTEKPYGYGNSKAHKQLNSSKPDHVSLFNAQSGIIATQPSALATPANASSWYVPSYAEMKLIKQEIDSINSAIARVSGGDQVSADLYWCSSHRDFAGGWYNAFSMTSSGWSSAGQNYNTSLPFRVVLAF